MKTIILLFLSSILVFGAETKKSPAPEKSKVLIQTAQKVVIKPEDILKIRNLQVKYLTLLQSDIVKNFIQTSSNLNATIQEVQKQYNCSVMTPTEDGFDCISTGKTNVLPQKEKVKK